MFQDFEFLLAMQAESFGEDLEPPFLAKPCPTPYKFAPETDCTRAPQAFLHWAIPKLVSVYLPVISA